jgi:superoxide dismutase, Fe-Mn family
VDKRTFIKSVFLGSTALFISSKAFKLKASVSKKKWDGKFILPEFGFAYGAFEPYLNSHALKLHHIREHAAYTEQFNAAVRDAGLTGKTAYEILTNASKYSETIRHTGGGFLNHKLFWKMLSPAKGQQPSAELMKAFTRDFGSFDSFRENFSQAANSFPSDGWAWLIYSDNRLKITCMADNKNPIMNTASERGVPLLCLDLWKHAYSEYPGNKAAYIGAYWNVVNWDFISMRYNRNLKKGQGTKDKGQSATKA